MQHYNAKQQAQKSVFITLQPSYLLAFLYVFFGCLVSGCLMLLPLTLSLISLLIFLVLLSCFYIVLLQALLLLPWSVTALTLNSKNVWIAKNKHGKELPVLIDASTFVAHYLTVINMTIIGRYQPHTMVIFPSRVNPDDYRKLRVILRWGKVHTTGSAVTLDSVT